MRIARVAMDAGVSTSLVHYHFETREALLAEALEYSYEMAADVRLGEAEGEYADPSLRLLAMIDQCLPYPGRAAPGLGALGRAVAAHGPPPRAPADGRAAVRADAQLARRRDRRLRLAERSATPLSWPTGCSRCATASGCGC